VLETIRRESQIVIPEQRNKPYASVSLSCSDDCCQEARELAGRRLLVEEAPALPLAGCGSADCNCHYFRYGDRRSLLGNRRSGSLSGAGGRNWFWQRNRRRGADRRKLKVAFI
jgi:hypothetical protein